MSGSYEVIYYRRLDSVVLRKTMRKTTKKMYRYYMTGPSSDSPQ